MKCLKRFIKSCWTVTACLLALAPQTLTAAPDWPGAIDTFSGKPRIIVLSDIGNEPDDQMSLVRLLLYANSLDIEGLIATTSTWKKTGVNPQTMHELIDAYGAIRPNLIKNAAGWPESAALHALVYAGQPGYGLASTGSDFLSSGAAAIVQAADRPDIRPLWISVWGGANTLAEALIHVRATRSPEELATFVAKLRVYSISDQDDAGPWIRREFPKLFYVVRPTPPDGSEYYYATWTGISGDVFYRNGEGAEAATVTNTWLDSHIRKGPLGAHYPKFVYIMEGDTPAFLGLIENGLNSYRSPSWGGWGGRYVYRQPYGETHAIWSQGGDAGGRITSQDTVTGADGKIHVSDQATIWRWRTAFQNDFAARMDWTVKPFSEANHNPIAVVNGINGTAPIVMEARVGRHIVLDGSQSHDPDKDRLHFHWFVYAEAGFAPGETLAAVKLANAEHARATVTAVAPCHAPWIGARPQCEQGISHIILEVTDSGSPALTTYRRIILKVSS